MGKTGLRQRRIFSEAVKKKAVKDIEKGVINVVGVCREYGVSGTSVYKWLKKFSTYLQPSQTIVVEMESEQYKRRELEEKLQELEAALGRKQMEIDYLNRLLDLAGKEFQVDLKKNFTGKHLNGIEGKRKGKEALP
jgi:transposase-like protein